MERELITVREYCINYAVEPAFINALEESGLIELTLIGEDKYIRFEQLVEMERFIHFHYELQINIEGIDAILHMLRKVKQLQREIGTLKSHIRLHEHAGRRPD